MDYKKRYLELKEKAEAACQTDAQRERVALEVQLFAEKGWQEYIGILADMLVQLDKYERLEVVESEAVSGLYFLAVCRNKAAREADVEALCEGSLQVQIKVAGVDAQCVRERLVEVANCVDPVLAGLSLPYAEFLLTSMPKQMKKGERILISRAPVDRDVVKQFQRFEVRSTAEAKAFLLVDVICY